MMEISQFPIKIVNLENNWYEFNDSFVRPIVPGRLESQFGNGSSNQSAYILVYKLKEKEEKLVHQDIPSYWVDEILKRNQLAEKEKEAYEFERNKLEIYLQPQILFDIQPNKSLRYLDVKDTEEQGVKIKFSFDNTVKEVKEMIRQVLSMDGDQNFSAFETCQLSNELNQIF